MDDAWRLEASSRASESDGGPIEAANEERETA